MDKGSVKFFDSRDSKRFGFIRMEDGRQIFFHLNDYRPLEVRQDGRITFEHEGATKQMPRVGDRLVFMQVEGSKGPKASSWAYAEEYEKLETRSKQIIEANAVLYRVMVQYTVVAQKPQEPKVTFEGNLKELNRRYPKPYDRRFDDCTPYFSCGDFDVSRWFERKDGEQWVRCNDPRTEVSDAEYRRMQRGG